MRTMTRGYVPAVAQSSELAAVADDLRALDEMRTEVLARIDSLAERKVTRRELKRDLRYTDSGLRILSKSRWFCPKLYDGQRRETYELRPALRLAVRFPGLAQAPTVRTVRKGANITTVLRETVQRLLSC